MSKNTHETKPENGRAKIPVQRVVIPRYYVLKCVVTGQQLKVLAKSFDEAGDLFVDNGWSYDAFLGGYVCLEARAV